jgi:hypothetical protein
VDATHPVDVAYPDTLLVGGKIVTVDPNATVAEALAILNGRISAIGSSAEIRRLAGPLTSIVELFMQSATAARSGSGPIGPRFRH